MTLQHMDLPKSTRAALRRMSLDGMIFSTMVGCGEQFIPLFVLALGFGQVAAGLVTTIPPLAGAILQLICPIGVRWLGSHKRWVVVAVSCQSLSFLPLVLGALNGRIPLWGVFLAVTMYWAAGSAAGPAWTHWAGTVVPRRFAASYFANRSRLCQLGVVIGVLSAGAALGLFDDSKQNHPAVSAFSLVFGIAFLCRAASACCLCTIPEPEPLPLQSATADRRLTLGRLHAQPEIRLLAALAAINMCLQIANPFIIPFMKGRLGQSDAAATALLMAAYLGRIVALPLLGRIAHRVGSMRLLKVAAIMSAPATLLWFGPHELWYLLVAQFLTGICLAAWELSSFLVLYEHLPEHSRTTTLTAYNLANALSTLAGSAIGAAILGLFDASLVGYFWIFGIAALLRSACALVLHPHRLLAVNTRHHAT